MTGTVFTILGLIIIGAFAVQALLQVVATLGRNTAEKKHQQLYLQRWEHQVEAAKGQMEAARKQEKDSWVGWRKFEIARAEHEDPTEQIRSIYLVPHDGKTLPPFNPGQFLTFDLRIPGIEEPIKRCYSLSDQPDPDYYRISVKLVKDGRSSGFFHKVAEVGTYVDVRAPGGKFYIDMADDFPIVMLGSGVGITPFLSMCNAITSAGSRREAWLFYGARDENELACQELLEKLGREHPNLHIHFCFSKIDPKSLAGNPNKHAGRVSVPVMEKILPSNNYDYYMCGPGVMMESLKEQLADWGVPKEKVHYEAFGAIAIPKKDLPPPVEGAPKIKVEFKKSGQSFDWDPSVGSLLDFAEKNGLSLECGCRAGNCGTCQTAVRSGEVEYLADPDYEVEEGSCLTCLGIPKGENLVLDA